MDFSTSPIPPVAQAAELLDGSSLDVATEKLAQLRALLPDAFSEGKLDVDKLRLVLGEAVHTGEERYGLNWPGKAEAYKEIQKRTTATLAPDRAGSVEFDTSENVFIEGENLEVLRVLQKSYFGQVKMIFIDPPYNTGNDSFVYPDDYSERQAAYKKRAGITDNAGNLNKSDLWRTNTRENGQYHSVWLGMMMPRLYLSRNLLREDGVIFVSIDDNEVTNLRHLLDEIYGEENFVASIIWQKKYSPQNDAKWFSAMHDYVLVYAKNKELWRPYLLERTEEMNARYTNPDNDPRGPWKSGDFLVKTYSADYDYPITTPSGRVVSPPSGSCWRTSRTNFQKLVDDNRISFGKDGSNIPSVKRFLSEVKQGVTPSTLWLRTEVGDNQEATKEVRDLFNGLPFDTPKPTRLLKRMLDLGTRPDEQHLVLDFFAGSATTAHAVMAKNLEDGGNRKFICIQLPEAVDEISGAAKLGYTNIADVSKARIQKAAAALQSAAAKSVLHPAGAGKGLGFRSYRLVDTNFKVWQPRYESKEALLKQLELFTDSLQHEHPDEEALLTELYLKAGKPLTSKPSIIHSRPNVYQLDASLCLAFGPLTSEALELLTKAKPKELLVLSRDYNTPSGDAALSNIRLDLREAGIALSIL
ncbi:site-specific DNA-methyltransferase [Hymenobacter sp. YC55]|uniref:site-specific DNA-methyltransferase n=1 Tax=Hymenobacter sp. YC55 TaxID=3034019 RepID=UPI0023F78BC9|nr:site-specific DNA-methyltransferase [Hymenobacter sp. YC55]MDF7811643.1 site-specific DNA-methyltransferase [Hymenobacter sp. YC55]